MLNGRIAVAEDLHQVSLVHMGGGGTISGNSRRTFLAEHFGHGTTACSLLRASFRNNLCLLADFGAKMLTWASRAHIASSESGPFVLEDAQVTRTLGAVKVDRVATRRRHGDRSVRRSDDVVDKGVRWQRAMPLGLAEVKGDVAVFRFEGEDFGRKHALGARPSPGVPAPAVCRACLVASTPQRDCQGSLVL